MMDKMNIGFLTMEVADNRPKDSVGSSRIRGRWVYDNWEGAEEYHIGREYDAIILQKVYWESLVDRFGGIKILDICDPDWLEGKPVMEFIRKCDACVTSTDALADYIKQFVDDRPVICIPDRLEMKEHKEKHGKHSGQAKSVVWFGYAHNQHYLDRAVPALKKLGLELTVISNKPYTPPTGMGAITYHNVSFDYENFNKEMVKHDIALLPTPRQVDIRGRYKSNNKTISALALGLPVATLPDELETLMEPSARNKVMKRGLEEVSKNWDVKLSVKEYQELIKEVWKSKTT